MLFRRIPAILMAYRFMPNVCKNVKEALFMGYFGPIGERDPSPLSPGIGAGFYLEHTRHLFPHLSSADAEETNLLRALGPTVYFLVLFSIIFHGLSFPALYLLYKRLGVPPVVDDESGPVELRPLSLHAAKPMNSAYVAKRGSVVVYNRFSRGPGRDFDDGDDMYALHERDAVKLREMV